MAMDTLKAGDIAPDFTLLRDGGSEISLSSLQPAQKVVLYFYPKDSTPGCTLEANDFSALHAEFAAAETIVIGISKDSVKSHDNFCKKQNLKVILASDSEGKTCEYYRVWGEKKLYGKTFMGIERTTFLINRDGKIAQVWNKVAVKGHAAAVLAAAQAL